MNKIEKLIKELCPNGVEWKKLGEVCECITGGDSPKDCVKGQKFPTKDYPYPVYANGDETYGYAKSFRIDKYAVTISSIGNVGTAYYREPNFTPIIRLKTFIPKGHNLNVKFLYYCLSAMSFVGTNSSLSSMKAADFHKIPIPLPPLPIQTEIVRILDKFVEQQEQLERLIELRKKQYEYYREEMLKPKEGEKWKTVTIGDLGTITRGRRFVRDDVRESGMPCIHYGDMYTYYGITARTTKTFLDRNFPKKMQYAKKGDVVVVGAGENDLDIGVGMVWEGDEPAAVHDACYILTHNQNSKYIAYFLRTNNYHQQLRKYVSDGKICSISGVGLGSCLIPIPSLKKQQEIVEFLDKFEFSITALTSALEASKKRYEYYRDEMMRF